MKTKITFFGILLIAFSCTTKMDETVGNTVITKWQGDKKSAISITFDDGIINQFTVARPILNKLGLPGTFYIITGKVEGAGEGKFIGRPNEEIIKETATIKTNADNFFERASLIGFTGTTEAVDYHSNAGSLFESGKVTEAYALIDEGYEKLRKGDLKNTDDVIFHDNPVDTSSWEDYKNYTLEGHEVASHSVTHPKLAVLDEENLLYELEQSKADIQKYLGERYTFSAECPYGTENERVMEYAHKIYPSLRNRMPEPYLEELNRGSKKQPGESEKEYVQWQRGPLSDVSMEKMKSWVDTCAVHDNIWLVLVFHGVDGIGWEPKTAEELDEYFSYMKEKEDHLWIATFADVTKYIRERKNAIISESVTSNRIEVAISSDLDSLTYNIPVTLKTYVPTSWNHVLISKKSMPEEELTLAVQKDDVGTYVVYSSMPNEEGITLSEKAN